MANVREKMVIEREPLIGAIYTLYLPLEDG